MINTEVEVSEIEVDGVSVPIATAELPDNLATTEYVDTKVSGLSSSIPTRTSQLTNDSGFITIDDVPTSSGASSVYDVTLQDIETDLSTYTCPKFTGTIAMQIYNDVLSGKNVVLKYSGATAITWTVTMATYSSSGTYSIVVNELTYEFTASTGGSYIVPNTPYDNLTTLNGARKDLSNVTYPANTLGTTTTGTADIVVETYISSDSKTWYRKWKSGWKECCAYATGTNSTTITLPITFSTSNYTAIACINHDNLGDIYAPIVSSKTTNQVTIDIGDSRSMQKCVYCSGY